MRASRAGAHRNIHIYICKLEVRNETGADDADVDARGYNDTPNKVSGGMITIIASAREGENV